MKKSKKWHVCLVISALLTCCQIDNRDDRIYFNGEIREFNDADHVQNITLSKVELEGPYYGPFATWDSLIIFRNFKLSGYHINIFNLNTGQELGNYCARGAGPEDFIAVGTVDYLFTEDGDLKTWLFTGNEEKLVKWNISKSVQTGKTVFDTIIAYKWQEENNFACYNYIFRLSDDTIIAYVQSTSTPLNEKDITVPFYQKRSILDNKLIHKYDIFNKPVYNASTQLLPVFYFNSLGCMKPDGSKIVQGMNYLCQINIIDVHTGQVQGFRMKHTPDFSLFKTKMNGFKHYYSRVQADNDYIYVTYCGKPLEYQLSDHSAINTLHVFDWNGRLIKKLIVDHSIDEFWLDQITNKLYMLDMSADELYVCDMNQLDME